MLVLIMPMSSGTKSKKLKKKTFRAIQCFGKKISVLTLDIYQSWKSRWPECSFGNFKYIELTCIKIFVLTFNSSQLFLHISISNDVFAQKQSSINAFFFTKMYFDFHLFICMITAMKHHLQFVMFNGMKFMLAGTAKGAEYLANVIYLTSSFLGFSGTLVNNFCAAFLSNVRKGLTITSQIVFKTNPIQPKNHQG